VGSPGSVRAGQQAPHTTTEYPDSHLLARRPKEDPNERWRLQQLTHAYIRSCWEPQIRRKTKRSRESFERKRPVRAEQKGRDEGWGKGDGE
jgi:hypothetical protein